MSSFLHALLFAAVLLWSAGALATLACLAVLLKESLWPTPWHYPAFDPGEEELPWLNRQGRQEPPSPASQLETPNPQPKT